MTAPGALQGLRVLDLSDEKGQYCTKLMADMGADVIKIEPPAGDPVRRIGPFYHDEEQLDKSLYWFVLNTSKRGVTLDISTPRGADLFRRLAATADFVVESFAPGTMDQLGLGYEALQQQRPNLILTSVTNYGQTGPYRDYAATDLDILGMSGTLFVCGDPDRAPTRVNAPQAPIYAGIQAFAGSLLAHYHRLESGDGQQVDVSMHECAALLHYSQLIWNAYGLVMVRLGDRLQVAPGAVVRYCFPCQDGYVQAIPQLTWSTFVPWMDDYGMAGELTSPEWEERLQTLVSDWDQEHIDYSEQVIANFLARFTKRELYEEGQRRYQFVYPVYHARDSLEDQQLQHREYFAPVTHAELGATLTYPGAPWKLSRTPWRLRRRAPLLG
ncbi:MAG: CoA transferase, partial [Candidatus Tectomicrobia bacterium]|nr:CoA transferase [Candidatus Tectomicrobia bacterium]